MKKLIDRINNEVVFYEGEEEKAAKYFDVAGSTLEEISERANEKDEAEGTDFSNRYSVVEF